MSGKTPEQWQIEDANRLMKIFDESGFKQEGFGYEFSIGTQSMVGQYLHAKRPLSLTSVAKFAYGLKVPIDLISPTLAAQIRALSSLAEPPSDVGYKPKSILGEAAARIIDSMSQKQQDDVVKIVTALAAKLGGNEPLTQKKIRVVK